MRVIAGTYRSRRLQTLRGLALRHRATACAKRCSISWVRRSRRGVRRSVRRLRRRGHRGAQPRRARSHLRRESRRRRRRCCAAISNRSEIPPGGTYAATAGPRHFRRAPRKCSLSMRRRPRTTRRPRLARRSDFRRSALRRHARLRSGARLRWATRSCWRPTAALILEHDRRRALPAVCRATRTHAHRASKETHT